MNLLPLLVPGGSDTHVQFNDGGTLGGEAALTYNKATNVLTSTGTINASAGKILITDNDVSEPGVESDGFISVAIIGGQPRLYWTVGGAMYYVEGSASAAIFTGSPIGLLLCLTYNLE